MPGVSTRGVGLYRANRVHRAYFGRTHKTSTPRPGAILLYSINGTADEFFGPGYYGEGFLQHYASAGIPAVSIEVDALWGNAEMRARISDMRTWAQANLGFAAGGVHLFGTSMGSLAALRYAMANPSHVLSITTAMTIPDVQDVYTNNRGGLAAGISTAYGGAPADSENPADNPSSFSAIPLNLYYSSTDPIGLPATVTDFAAAVGANAVATNLGALGHNWLTINNAAPAQFAAFGIRLPPVS